MSSWKSNPGPSGGRGKKANKGGNWGGSVGGNPGKHGKAPKGGNRGHHDSSGGANGAVLFLAVALIGVPFTVLALIVGYFVAVG